MGSGRGGDRDARPPGPPLNKMGAPVRILRAARQARGGMAQRPGCGSSRTAGPTAWSLGLALAALSTGALHAQAPTRPDSSAEDTLRALRPRQDALPLAPLRVTVTRTEAEPLLLPFAVAVLDERAFGGGERGISLDEALRAVPGITVQNRRNFALGDRIAVRGAGARAQFGVRGVRVLLDGIPLTMPDGQSALSNLDPASVGRAEIVRGPAAALYGNAAGGVLAFRTREPGGSPASGGPRLLAGSHGLIELRGEASGSDGDLGWSATASRLELDGFREHAHAEVWRGSALLRVRPTSRASLTAVLHGYHTPFAENPSSLAVEDAEEDPRHARAFIVAQGAGESTTQVQAGLAGEAPLNGRLDLGGALWGVVRDLWNPIPGRIIDLARRAGGGRVQVAGSTQGDTPRLRFTAGVELEAQRDRRRESENLGVGSEGARAREGEAVLNQRETVVALGPFALGELRLAPRWRLTLAARWDRYRFRAEDRLLDDGDDSGTRVMSRLSPAAGLVFVADPAVSLYANLSTAFQTPTASELSNRPDGSGGFDPDLGPERTLSVEIGAKGSLPGPGLVFDLALYRATVTDALIPFEGPTEETFFRNAGESDRSGLEAALAWRVVSSLELRAAYAWQRFRFDEFATEGGDFSGRSEPGVAEHAVDLEAYLRWPGFLRSEVDLRWIDAFPVDDANTASNASSRVVDLRIWVDPRRTRVRPFIGVDNLFGERYNGSVVPNAFGGRYYEPAPGFEVYGGLSLSLGASAAGR